MKNYKNYSEIIRSKGLKEQQELNTYYGNGSFADAIIITEIGEYFIYHDSLKTGAKRVRDSHQTVLRYLKNGNWKIS